MATDTKNYPYGTVRQAKLAPDPIRDQDSGVLAFGENAVYDNRFRVSENGIVLGAPRKFKIKTIKEYADGGEEVSENYPFIDTLKKKVLESNTPRATRGIRQGTPSDGTAGDSSIEGGGHNYVHTFFASLPATAKPGATVRNPIVAFPPERSSPQYPYNSVRLTESGHLFEVDDTPGAERIKEAHRRGTFYEILDDGTKVTKIVKDKYTLVVGNDFVNVRGAAIVTVEGDCNLYTKGNLTQQVGGDYNINVKGAYNLKCRSNMAVKVDGNYHEVITKNKNSDIKQDKKVEIGANESRMVGTGKMFGGVLSVGWLGMGNRSISVLGTESKMVRMNKNTYAFKHSSSGAMYETTALFEQSSLTFLGNTTIASGGFISNVATINLL